MHLLHNNATSDRPQYTAWLSTSPCGAPKFNLENAGTGHLDCRSYVRAGLLCTSRCQVLLHRCPAHCPTLFICIGIAGCDPTSICLSLFAAGLPCKSCCKVSPPRRPLQAGNCCAASQRAADYQIYFLARRHAERQAPAGLLPRHGALQRTGARRGRRRHWHVRRARAVGHHRRNHSHLAGAYPVAAGESARTQLSMCESSFMGWRGSQGRSWAPPGCREQSPLVGLSVVANGCSGMRLSVFKVWWRAEPLVYGHDMGASRFRPCRGAIEDEAAQSLPGTAMAYDELDLVGLTAAHNAQRWVRPAPAPALPVHSASGLGCAAGEPAAGAAGPAADPAIVAAPPRPRSALGAPITALAVPAHDLLEDEAAVQGVLDWEEAHRRVTR